MESCELHAVIARTEAEAHAALRGGPTNATALQALLAAVNKAVRAFRFQEVQVTPDSPRHRLLGWEGDGFVFLQPQDDRRLVLSWGPLGGLRQSEVVQQARAALWAHGAWLWNPDEAAFEVPPSAPTSRGAFSCSSCGDSTPVWDCERCESEVRDRCPVCHSESVHF